MRTVIIASRHPQIRRRVRLHLGMTDDICVLTDTDDGTHLRGLVQDLRPDVAVIDVALRPRGGLATLAEVSAHTTPIVLTRRVFATTVARAVLAGARGVLSPGIRDDARLRTAIRDDRPGSYHLSPTMADALVRALDDHQGTWWRETLADEHRRLLAAAACSTGHVRLVDALRLHPGTAIRHLARTVRASVTAM